MTQTLEVPVEVEKTAEAPAPATVPLFPNGRLLPGWTIQGGIVCDPKVTEDLRRWDLWETFEATRSGC